MPELLLEVGCEELPAEFVRKAYSDLLAKVTGMLSELFDAPIDGVAFGTPRRLIISVPSLPDRQPDSVKEVRGPALKAAYDADGNPTGALQGFCRSNGVTTDDLRKDETYVWLTKTVSGLPTAELLADVLPKAIRSLTFEKSMRWGSSRMRFARPIRWILAAFDGRAVEFDIEGVRSGTESRGHRSYAPGCFKATTIHDLLKELRDRKVEPDVDIRAESIKQQAIAVAGGAAYLPDELVDENAFLTEWPTAIAGEFRQEHLSLPAPVLMTAMAKHEKMFPVNDPSGELVNRFIFIRNSGEDDTVRIGAEWVLNARLDDAQFFFKEDSKHDLDYFLEKTNGIVFQEKLGTVRERADRLETLAGFIADQYGLEASNFGPTAVQERDLEAGLARQAGRYAKADLSTGLVGDMASLQGIVGGEYARSQGLAEQVCWALSCQYDHTRNRGNVTANGRVATYLAVSDHIDKLAGYLGLGITPTGSSDPYGLRRSAQALVDISLDWERNSVWDFDALIRQAVLLYEGKLPALCSDMVAESFEELLKGRYAVHFASVRRDVVEAASWSDAAKPQFIRNRINTLKSALQDKSFVQVAVRAINLVAAEEKKGWSQTQSLGQQGNFFYQTANAAGTPDATAVVKGFEEFIRKVAQMHGYDSSEVAQNLWALTSPVNNVLGAAELPALVQVGVSTNKFLDANLINDADPAIRDARLNVLKLFASTVKLFAGDFTKIVVEG